MLAYVFWHRPAEGTSVEGYERDQDRLHRSLAARPPEGFRGSACFRAPALRWLTGAPDAYEDWYLVDDWAALGVLRQAVVAVGHHSAHDAAARHLGAGTAGVYRLSEGAASLADVTLAVWIAVTREHPEDAVASLLLGDGLDRARAGLWRRELVLGPAPEYCVLGAAVPAGVRDDRLPAGWTAERCAREAIHGD
jgi:hypothetical protein